jgi:hypothetical protein
MKNLNITFEDEDFEKIKAVRRKLPHSKSWEEFILIITGVKKVILENKE